jgi:hypothetical protein
MEYASTEAQRPPKPREAGEAKERRSRCAFHEATENYYPGNLGITRQRGGKLPRSPDLNRHYEDGWEAAASADPLSGNGVEHIYKL